MKYTNIQKIVITNKKNEEGYLKFRNRIWKRIWNKNSTDESAEILSLWLEHNTNCWDNEKVFDYDKIKSDICNKCFCKEPKIYNLQYHEFVLSCKGNTNLLLNAKDFTLNDCDMYNNILCVRTGQKVLHLSQETPLQTIDISIVNDVLFSLIKDKNLVVKYKNLCYNILVRPDEYIVFSDYSHKTCLLSVWLNNLLYSISSADHPCGYMCHFDEKQKSTYRTLFKKNKPRVVFIYDTYIKDNEKHTFDKDELQKHIDFVKDLGIKNIVVNHTSNNNQYNYKKYMEYIVTNKDIIGKDKINIHQDNMNEEIEMGSYDEIFYAKDMLFNNFLKWCCSKP
jgi:hypothetical protein